MINSVRNGDWSNSVPGRKIPEGATDCHQGRLGATLLAELTTKNQRKCFTHVNFQPTIKQVIKNSPEHGMELKNK